VSAQFRWQQVQFAPHCMLAPTDERPPSLFTPTPKGTRFKRPRKRLALRCIGCAAERWLLITPRTGFTASVVSRKMRVAVGRRRTSGVFSRHDVTGRPRLMFERGIRSHTERAVHPSPPCFDDDRRSRSR
jgi:hypothetical protein